MKAAETRTWSLQAGGLSVVQVPGLAVHVLVRHVHGYAVQVEVTAAGASREAADGTSTPVHQRETRVLSESRKPVH